MPLVRSTGWSGLGEIWRLLDDLYIPTWLMNADPAGLPGEHSGKSQREQTLHHAGVITTGHLLAGDGEHKKALPEAGLKGIAGLDYSCSAATESVPTGLLASLMRRLRRRLKPKPAAMPKMGSGPGTGVGAEKLLIVAMPGPAVSSKEKALKPNVSPTRTLN
ncbi:hypothetical protein KBZ12_14525 [Cyanobium sp. Cruz CV13-4-11]|uniref:hypothetical protein n=1 Tax=unclassified Cyanobium TaxID=2627006 RepID=UPI0020CFAB9C|nr:MULTISPECIES: hypothetical protein [unclassified Cyanobium]MCP9902004.1 hypothetical protein [Cyanobium sp. Cruz CV11-17]MCP9920669.1 hypothetical protein [Cyanobium sp. Cruz CV13-4-11]